MTLVKVPLETTQNDWEEPQTGPFLQKGGDGYHDEAAYDTGLDEANVAATDPDVTGDGVRLSPTVHDEDADLDFGELAGETIPVNASAPGIIIAPPAARIYTFKGPVDPATGKWIDPAAAGDIVFELGTIECVKVPWLTTKATEADQSAAIMKGIRIAQQSGLVNLYYGPGHRQHFDPIVTEGGGGNGISHIGTPGATVMQGGTKPACTLEYTGTEEAAQFQLLTPYCSAADIAFINYGSAKYALQVVQGGRETFHRLSFVQPNGANPWSIASVHYNNSDYAAFLRCEFAARNVAIIAEGSSFTSLLIGDRCAFALIPIDDENISLGGYTAIIYRAQGNFFTIDGHTVFNFQAPATAIDFISTLGLADPEDFEDTFYCSEFRMKDTEHSCNANAASGQNYIAKLDRIRQAYIDGLVANQFPNNTDSPILYRNTNLHVSERMYCDSMSMPLCRSTSTFEEEDAADTNSRIYAPAAAPGMYPSLTQGVSNDLETGDLMHIMVGEIEAYPTIAFIRPGLLRNDATVVITLADGDAWSLSYGEPGGSVPALRPHNGQRIRIQVVNNTGGAAGSMTLSGDFRASGVLPMPADTKQRTFLFTYIDGYWTEQGYSDEVAA